MRIRMNASASGGHRSRSRARKIATLGMMAALTMVATGTAGAATAPKSVPHAGGAAAAAAAAVTYPPQTFSRYVATTNMYSMGCNQGKASDAQGQHAQLVLLNFGDPGWNDAGTFGAWDSYIGGFNSIAAIQANVQNYLQGFWDCTVAGSKSFLNVAPGVTNAGSGINSSSDTALGTAWGNMVKSLGAWISAKGYTAQLGALGSADFEPGYGAPSHAVNWANGFQSTGSYYYDFGSADGCPPYGGCDNGWTQAIEYQLAWGNPHAFAAPQIYNAAMAQEWASISAWGKAHGSSGAIFFSAALSQYQACADHGDPCSGTDFTPQQSWQALYSDTGQAPPFATEMSYQSS